MAVADVTECPDDLLGDAGFLRKLRIKAGTALRAAREKVLGLFDSRAGQIFVDRTLHFVRQTFIRLHETAHAYLPRQRPMYAVVEDSERTIDPYVADLYDREANTFASEVLFQLDAFSAEAADHSFGIFVPVRLSKKYGASIYASIRQYVSKSYQNCAVLVLDPPEPILGDGFRANLRRAIYSTAFEERFRNHPWPEYFTPDCRIGRLVPVGKRKASGKRHLELVDDDGNTHECIVEAFTQTHQVFILIHVTRALRDRLIVVA